MYEWGKIYVMALGSQAFLSLCEMKKIQLSNTNLLQPFHSTAVNSDLSVTLHIYFHIYYLTYIFYYSDCSLEWHSTHVNLNSLFYLGFQKHPLLSASELSTRADQVSRKQYPGVILRGFL